jgi:hypothetical protein
MSFSEERLLTRHVYPSGHVLLQVRITPRQLAHVLSSQLQSNLLLLNHN